MSKKMLLAMQCLSAIAFAMANVNVGVNAQHHCMPHRSDCRANSGGFDDAPNWWPDASWADTRGPAPRVAPIDSSPGGKSYGHWAVTWYRWLLSISSTPDKPNPVVDPDGSQCGAQQVDRVFFLAGSLSSDSVSRKCAVPAGNALFFPLINRAWFSFPDDPPEQRTERFARSQAKCTAPVRIEAWIDDVKVRNPTQYFTGPSGSRSPIFRAGLPADNLLGLPAGTEVGPNAEQGYYLFVRPLSPGTHKIRWIASGCSPDAVQDINYTLIVGDRRADE